MTRATDQSYVHKRKKIDFTVRDLESGAGDDSGSDQEWTVKRTTAGQAEAAAPTIETAVKKGRKTTSAAKRPKQSNVAAKKAPKAKSGGIQTNVTLSCTSFGKHIQTCAEKRHCFAKHLPGVAGCGWLQPGRNCLNLVPFLLLNLVQGGWGGWPTATGNGMQLSSSQAQLGQATILALA